MLMNSLHEKEETLREYACIGDSEGISYLCSLGININSQNELNGWTALHWACKRNHGPTVALLLEKGADKNIKNNNGEYPCQLCSDAKIYSLLTNGNTKDFVKKTNELPITPSYLKDPEFIYSRPIEGLNNYQELLDSDKNIIKNSANFDIKMEDKKRFPTHLIKIRVAQSVIQDFVEYQMREADLSDLQTFAVHCLSYLAQTIGPDITLLNRNNDSSTSFITDKKSCNSISASQFVTVAHIPTIIENIQQSIRLNFKEIKVRKLPNTFLVSRQDLWNLAPLQEIEFILEPDIVKFRTDDGATSCPSISNENRNLSFGSNTTAKLLDIKKTIKKKISQHCTNSPTVFNYDKMATMSSINQPLTSSATQSNSTLNASTGEINYTNGSNNNFVETEVLDESISGQTVTKSTIMNKSKFSNRLLASFHRRPAPTESKNCENGSKKAFKNKKPLNNANLGQSSKEEPIWY